MLLKIMSDENRPDDDSRKPFRLYDGVASVEFGANRLDGSGSTDDPPAWAHVLFESGHTESLYVNANVYVMNDAGKTISTFAPPRLRRVSDEEMQSAVSRAAA